MEEELYHIARNGIAISTFIGLIVAFVWKWLMKPSIFGKLDKKISRMKDQMQKEFEAKFADGRDFAVHCEKHNALKEDVDEWKRRGLNGKRGGQ